MRFWKKGLSLFLAASIVMGTLQPLSMEAHATEVTEEITSELEENVQEENVQDVEESPSEKLLENVEEQEFKEPVEEETAIEEETLEGKTISILGDSISTYINISNGDAASTTNSTILNNGAIYPSYNVKLDDMWWKQAADVLGMEILVNNSWAGSCIYADRAGAAAYKTRAEQLHDDTGENVGQEPDIIAVYLGTNDFTYYSDAQGSEEEIDYDKLISLENDDFVYAEPVTIMEAYAITLHKIINRYKESEIYCFTLLNRQPGAKGYDAEGLEQFNHDICELAAHFDVNVVDLYSECGVTEESANSDGHIGDDYVHPNEKGMDAIAGCFVSSVLKNSKYVSDEVCDITYNLENVFAEQGTPYAVLKGSQYQLDLKALNNGTPCVTVTMNGANISDVVVADGKISIPEVTGDVIVNAWTEEVSKKEAQNYYWEIIDNTLSSKGENVNAPILVSGSVKDGKISSASFQLEKNINLYHDCPWVIEWKGTGNWSGMLLSNDSTSENYLFKSYTETGLLAFGSNFKHYGIALAETGLDFAQSHTYRLENHIFEDGSNMVYLFLDNIEIGEMHHHYQAGSSNLNQTVSWLNGKDLEFSHLGSSTHPIDNLELEYLKIWENGYSNKVEVEKYNGKVISILGDSISTFQDYIPSGNETFYPRHDVLTVDDTWWMQLIEQLDAQLGVNESWSGSYVLNTIDGNSGNKGEDAAMASMNRIKKLGGNGDPDVILFFGGTNDIAFGSPLGNFDSAKAPVEVELNSVKWATYADAYVAAIMRMQHCYPEALIVSVLPTINNHYYNAETLEQYNSVMRSICQHYGVLYVDLVASGYSKSMFADATHPNATGMDFITNVVKEKLLSAHMHTYESVVTIPTCTEQGYTTYTCACGDSYMDNYVDATGHIYENGICTICGAENPNHYVGKTIACIGDSITAGVGVTKDETDYVTLLAQSLQMDYIRLGASGTTLCTDGHATCNIGKLTEKNLSGVDVVTILMGINDFVQARNGYYTLGTIESTDTSTIYGAVHMWCQRIEELRKTDSMKDTEFYFLTPVITSWNNSVSSTKDWNQDKTNVYGYTLRDLCNAIIEVCAKYDVQVIDLNLVSGLYYNNAEDNSIEKFGGDGAHPGTVGHQMMADSLKKALLQNNLENDHTHNFGSWITTTYPRCREGEQQRVCSVCNAVERRSVEGSGHTYENGICTGCGEDQPKLANYKGKVISILGDSISTFAGYIPIADGFNLEHLSRYPQDNLLTDVNETWWMQIINQLDAKLGINDSWRGATVSGAAPVTTGTTGENASMANLTRIQNLGSNGTPDVILFYGGTNDLAHVSNVGSFDSSTAPTTVDLTTKKWDNLADGYVNTLLRLKHFYPDAQIVCLLPTYTTSYYSNEKLAQGNEVLADICEHYEIAYVDLRESGINTSDLPDGIHPDAAGMDHITSAVMETLLTDCDMEKGEHIVYSVRHELDEVSASKGYYQGVSTGETFEEIITGNNTIVCVTMGGIDITSSAYADGKVSIPKVTGDVVIRAKGEKKPVYDKYLQSISEDICSGTNLWEKLECAKEYYTANGWAVHSSGKVSSVTIPVNPEDHIWATSFQKKGTNGGTIDGIRVTWFGEFDVIESMSADKVYQEFSENGYLTAPEGAMAVNVPVWNNSAENEVYILSANHNYTEIVTPPSGRNLGYTTYTCVSCSDKYKENIIDNSYFAGKKLVAIGDSLTNGTGVLANEVYAPLVADYLDMEVVRYGKSGAVLSMGGHLPTRIEVLDILPKDSDIVTIFLGVNDFTGGVKEGYYGGKLKYDPSATYYELGEFNSEDTTTIYGALRMYCEKIVELKSTETYKNTQFYFITPIILNKNKSISTKIDWSQDKENIHGIKLRDICNAIIETGEYYNIQVIDLNITSGMYYNSENDNSLNVYDGDGIHPGVIGHQMMADAIIKHLKQEYLREDHEHNYGSWITTIYPECTEAGETNRVCSECSKIESKKIEKLGHSFTHYISDGNATRYEDGTKTAKCDRCEVTDTQIEEGSKKVLTGIEVTSFPEKTVYQIRHEDLDVTGGILTLHYENAESEEIPLTLEMISGFNNRVQGEQKLTVSFEGMTTEFTVTVVAEKNVVIEKIPNQIYTGKQLKPEPEVYDGDMLLVKNKDYTVSYKNNVKAGVATVTIKGKGNYTKTQTVEFVIEPKSLEEEDVLIICADRFHNGKKQQSNPVLKWGKITLKNGTDYTLQFSGDLIKAGDVTVTITGKGNYTGERTVNYRITEKNISKAILETISTQYYTGEEIKPELVLYADKNAQKAKTPLILGEHYELHYENHIVAGKGKVTIVGIREYGGSRTASFTIKQRNLNSDGVLALFKENMGQDTYSEVYNGTALKPLIEVKDGEKILLENVDYKLSYANNKAAASASGKKKPTVTITGKGNYSGTKKLYFDIAPLDLSKENLEITVADAKYTKKAVKPAVTVKLNGKVLKNGTDYKLSYENNVNVCEKTEETAAYVRIQGIKNYTGEVIKTFRIYEAAVSGFVVDAIPAQTYMLNENGICPTVVVYANNTEKKLGHALEKDTHYVIKDYQNNKKAGTGKVVIEGIGEYGGSKTVAFKINPRKLSNVSVQLAENEFTYSGQAIKPGVKVYDGEIELKEKVDYTITYSNNVNVPSGTKKLPTVTIKGKGNYTGTLTQTFTITPKDLEKSADIMAEAKAVLFNQKTANSKKGITTSITIKDGSKTLKNNKNYKITGYLNNKTIGMAESENPPRVVIQGLGNYTGILEIPYNIYENSISKMSVAKLANEFYTGKEICPKPVVTQKVGKTETITLEEGKDYTLRWEKNIKIGKAKVIITGKGQYGGSKTVYFTIIPRWMSIIVK